MDIVIIGSGNVATVLGLKLKEAGHAIVQVCSRHTGHAATLADTLGASPATGWSGIRPDADFYLLAISDSAMHEFASAISLPDRLVAHTAGAVPMKMLASVSRHHGVFYPLQSLRKEIRPIPDIPLLLDASLPEDLETLSLLASGISDRISRADDLTRLKLHLSAIFVNNFTNHLFSVAKDFCIKEGMDFSLLLPIIDETARRLSRFSPEEVQTGPAIRGDAPTLQRHLELLSGYPGMQDIYTRLSKLIWEQYRPPENPFPL